MINQDPFSDQVCARMFDYFSHRAGWYRKSWDLGLSLGLRELEEAVSARDHGYLSNQAVRWLAGSLRRPGGRDPGVGGSEIRGTLQTCLSSALTTGSADHVLLAELATKISKNYLENWSRALEDTSAFTPEQVARALAEHLLDHGFHERLLHRWLSFHLRHNPEPLSLSDLAQKASELQREPLDTFEVIAGVAPLPGSRKPHGWVKMKNLRIWLEQEGYTLRNLRIGGGIRFSVEARDKWSAVSIVLQRLEQYEARVKIGTRDKRLGIEAVWVAATNGERFAPKPARKVDVLSLARQERLFESSEESPIDAPLQLAAPMDDGPIPSAVSGGWAAIETALGAPGDENNVVAADRLAEIVACSYPRAELTKLAAAYEHQGDDELSDRLSAGEHQREKCQMMMAAILDPHEIVEFKDPSHNVALIRLENLAATPKRELTAIKERATRSFRRLYRHRNLLLHGGLRDAAGVGRSLDAVSPIVGAGLDRLAHAWLAEKVDPLALSARARLEMQLLGSGDGSDLIDLLGDDQESWTAVPAYASPTSGGTPSIR